MTTILSFDLLHSYHTCDNKQYCHVGNTAKQSRLGLFQDSDFAGDLEESNFWESYICSNQLDV